MSVPVSIDPRVPVFYPGDFPDYSLLSGIQPGEPIEVLIRGNEIDDDGRVRPNYIRIDETAADTPGRHTVKAYFSTRKEDGTIVSGPRDVPYTVTAPSEASVEPVKANNGRWNLPTNLLSREQLARADIPQEARKQYDLPTEQLDDISIGEEVLVSNLSLTDNPDQDTVEAVATVTNNKTQATVETVTGITADIGATGKTDAQNENTEKIPPQSSTELTLSVPYSVTSSKQIRVCADVTGASWVV